MTVSDGNGNFSIVAKAKDLLILISKKYDLQKFLLEKETLDKDFLYVFLSLKPEQLKEAVVRKMPSLQLSKDKNWD